MCSSILLAGAVHFPAKSYIHLKSKIIKMSQPNLATEGQQAGEAKEPHHQGGTQCGEGHSATYTASNRLFVMVSALG